MHPLLWRKILGSWIVITIIFLYVPIAVVVLYAFNANADNVTVWTGFTTRWFSSFLDDSNAHQALFTSGRIAVVNAAISMALGTLAAVGLRFAPRWIRLSFDTLAYLTLVTPAAVLGISSLVAFVLAGIGRGSLTILLIHVVFNSSIVFLIVRARLVGLSTGEEEAAMDLGAGRWSTFRQVTLPMLSPAIVAGGLLAFTYSWDEFVIASFVNGAETKTLPIYIFSQLRFGVSPAVNVLATITLGVTLLVLVAVLVILRRSSPREGLAQIIPIAMDGREP